MQHITLGKNIPGEVVKKKENYLPFSKKKKRERGAFFFFFLEFQNC